MSEMMVTLHELGVEYAKKQPGMIDSFLEDAPIMRMIKWKEATHGLWNVAEKLTDVKAPAFVRFDAPLPQLGASSDLVTTELNKMGGMMEVPSDRAARMGGHIKYFADKQPYILKKSGMDAERVIVLDNLLQGAKVEKNLYDAGGSSKGWFAIACRFDQELNVGLYDSKQFQQGRLFNITPMYGGYEYLLTDPKYRGVPGYGVMYRANFGYQLLDAKRTVAAIVNIDREHYPSPDQIDDMLAQVRAQPGNTYLFMGPRARIYGFYPHKEKHIMYVNGDKNVNTHVELWNDIRMVISHNFDDMIDHITV